VGYWPWRGADYTRCSATGTAVVWLGRKTTGRCTTREYYDSYWNEYSSVIDIDFGAESAGSVFAEEVTLGDRMSMPCGYN